MQTILLRNGFYGQGQVASYCEGVVKLPVTQEVRNFVTTGSEMLGSPGEIHFVEVFMY